MKTAYEIFHDPMFYVIIFVFSSIVVYLFRDWLKGTHVREFEDEVVENNLRRLITKKNIDVSIQDIKTTMQLLSEVEELRQLLKDQDLSHYQIRRQIYDKLIEGVEIYRRAGVPENRITQVVPVSKF